MLITREFTNAEVADLLEQLPRVGLPQAGIVAEAVKRLRAAALASQAAEPASDEEFDANLREIFVGQGPRGLMLYCRRLFAELKKARTPPAPPAGISPAPLAGSDEQAAFERHIRSTWKVPESYLDWALKRNDRGYYLDGRAADQWSGWQARAALSQGDVSGEGEG